MPTISIFYGIVIQIFWRDHNPPHFHALYGEYEAVFDVRDLRVLHRDELMENWNLCSQLKSPKPIDPLT